MNNSTPVTFDDAAKETALKVANLVVKKQKDYGPNNILKCPVGAELGIIVRLYDKLARYSNLYEKQQKNSKADVNFEALEDTIDDIIGYGIILKMVSENSFTLPLQEK